MGEAYRNKSDEARCAAMTRAGTRCTRWRAMKATKRGQEYHPLPFCLQHYHTANLPPTAALHQDGTGATMRAPTDTEPGRVE